MQEIQSGGWLCYIHAVGRDISIEGSVSSCNCASKLAAMSNWNRHVLSMGMHVCEILGRILTSKFYSSASTSFMFEDVFVLCKKNHKKK